MNAVSPYADWMAMAAQSGPPRLLHECFERQVARRPDHPAIECNGETVSYAELDGVANRIARYLAARGVGRATMVAVCFEKSCTAFAAILGILKAGGTYVPIDPRTPAARIRGILDDAKIGLLLSANPFGAQLPPFKGTETVLLDTVWAQIAAYPRAPISGGTSRATDADPCYVIFTSGSTGKPKGVVIEHRHAMNFVASLDSVYRIVADDRIYQGFSLAFDASVEETWAALSLGGTLIVPPEAIARSPADAADFIDANAITVFSTVPSFLAMIDQPLPSVRLLVVGGEDCPAELVSRWAGDRRMLNTYGPTETTVVATAAECRPGEAVTIGRPLPGYRVRVLDARGRPVRAGETGELFIGGLSVARGYLGRDDLTRERFIADPHRDLGAPAERLYRTHDLVRLMDDGSLKFIGRNDTLVKIRGFRIELSEVEAALIEQPGIRAAAVVVQKTGTVDDLSGFVVLAADTGDLDRQALSRSLRERLPDYMVPKFLDIVAELPRLASGKLDRDRLPAGATLLSGGRREATPAATATEKALVACYETCFRISPISVTDDFFTDLGGHSLIAARVVSELRRVFDTNRIRVRDCYDFRTIREFARHLERNGIAVAPSNIGADNDALDQEGSGFTRIPTPGRWACAVLQGLGLALYYTTIAAPAALAILLALAVLDGTLDPWTGGAYATALGFAVWPSWLAISIAMKWLVIGRYRKGRYPVWGSYYFRWWLVSRFQGLSWSGMFVGTPLMSLYYRAMGARIGRNVTICTAACTAFDLVSIGDDSSIGAETQLLGYRVESGWLIVDEVAVGRDCYVGAHSNLGLAVAMGDGAMLDDMTALADGATVLAGEGRSGSVASPATLRLPPRVHAADSAARRFGYGALHLVLIYAMGYLLLLGAAPAVAVAAVAFFAGGAPLGAAAVFIGVPLSQLTYLLIVIAVKRLVIGRIAPGRYRLTSPGYLRLWFLTYLLDNLRHIVLPIYATLLMPKVLRALGATVGRGVEISTVMQVSPDLLDIADGSFLADACIVGGQRIHAGVAEVLPNRIGARAFIGNSAFVGGGKTVGADVLIGVMSTGPANTVDIAPDTRWLGAPSFALPTTQAATCVARSRTYEPTTVLVLLRAAMESLRILLPALLLAANIVGFVAVMVVASRFVAWPALLLLAPGAAFGLGAASMIMTALIKRLLIGAFVPAQKALWSPYVWANEVVNGVYESVAAIAMAPMMGTPFLAPWLRLMGCRVGRWCVIETTLFSEFDLVEIGDRVCLNLGVTVQTHLFEDRVMKSDRLVIGNDCSIGNMSAILYGTEMKDGAVLGPLSLIMKGDSLPAHTRWHGIPTELCDPAQGREPVARPVARAA